MGYLEAMAEKTEKDELCAEIERLRAGLNEIADNLNACRPSRNESADLGEKLLAIAMKARAFASVCSEEPK